MKRCVVVSNASFLTIDYVVQKYFFFHFGDFIAREILTSKIVTLSLGNHSFSSNRARFFGVF